MNALPLHNSLKALKGRERGLRVTGLIRKLTACLIVSCVEKKRMKRGKNSEKKMSAPREFKSLSRDNFFLYAILSRYNFNSTCYTSSYFSNLLSAVTFSSCLFLLFFFRFH